MAPGCDLVLVIGSRNSSNSNRLVEVAREHGAEAHLLDREDQTREAWLEGTRVVASPRAPAPPTSSSPAWWRSSATGVSDVEEYEVVREDVRFMAPKQIRAGQAAAAGATA